MKEAECKGQAVERVKDREGTDLGDGNREITMCMSEGREKS